jgi:membrane associated rhomboid family serine protease
MVTTLEDHLRHAAMTFALVLVNVAIFIAQTLDHDLAGRLLLDPDLAAVLARPWTLGTAMFLHELVAHMVAMVAVLLVIGPALERITSAGHMLLVYVISGVTGALAAVAVANVFRVMHEPSLGASAAVLGLVAAFAVMRPRAILLGYRAKHWLLALVAASIVLVFAGPLGTAAHLGGLIAGALCGLWSKDTDATGLDVATP